MTSPAMLKQVALEPCWCCRFELFANRQRHLTWERSRISSYQWPVWENHGCPNLALLTGFYKHLYVSWTKCGFNLLEMVTVWYSSNEILFPQGEWKLKAVHTVFMIHHQQIDLSWPFFYDFSPSFPRCNPQQIQLNGSGARLSSSWT